MTTGRLVILTGPSGVGKGSVVSVLRRGHPHVWLSVSVTTRAARPGEVDGVHYHFVDDAEFDRMVAAGELLEWAGYADNRYGTPRTPVYQRLAAGESVLLEIDLAGARQMRTAAPDALFVFLAPPSWDELERRLVGRATEPAEVIARRLDRGRVEIGAADEFDVTVVNDVVERAATELVELICHSPCPAPANGPVDHRS